MTPEIRILEQKNETRKWERQYRDMSSSWQPQQTTSACSHATFRTNYPVNKRGGIYLSSPFLHRSRQYLMLTLLHFQVVLASMHFWEYHAGAQEHPIYWHYESHDRKQKVKFTCRKVTYMELVLSVVAGIKEATYGSSLNVWKFCLATSWLQTHEFLTKILTVSGWPYPTNRSLVLLWVCRKESSMHCCGRLSLVGRKGASET